MQNYSLLLTYNKDTKILDLLNSETENEIIYTSKEIENISINQKETNTYLLPYGSYDITIHGNLKYKVELGEAIGSQFNQMLNPINIW